MNSQDLNSKHQRYATTLVLKLAQWVQALPTDLPSSFIKTKEWQSMIASYEYLNKLHKEKHLSRTTARNFVDVKSALHEIRMDVDVHYANEYSSVVAHREAIIQQAMGSKHMRYARRIQLLQELHREWGQLPSLLHLHERALWYRFKSAVKEAQRYETKTRQFEVADVEVAYEVKKHLLHEAKLVLNELSKTKAQERLQSIDLRWRNLPTANLDLDKRLRAKLRDIQRAVEERPEE
jgi:hypothetical protein